MERSVVVLKGPASWVVELISKLHLSGDVGISLGSEDWVGVVLGLHSIHILGESSIDVTVENGLVLLDEWAINWVGGESHGILGNLLELGVNSLGLGGGHTNGPELLGASDGWSGGSLELLDSVLKSLHLLVHVLGGDDSGEGDDGGEFHIFFVFINNF